MNKIMKNYFYLFFFVIFVQIFSEMNIFLTVNEFSINIRITIIDR